MKKFLKYGLIIILIIIASLAYLLSSIESDVSESRIKNFETDPNIKVQISENIKQIETSFGDYLTNSVNNTLNELEKKYPDNQDIKSLRKEYNEALIVQKQYKVKREKEIKKEVAEKIEKEKKLRELKELEKKKQEASAKPIAMSAVCNNKSSISTYMRAMESARLSDALRFINNEPGCSLGLNAKSNSDIFTKQNSVVLSKGRWYLILSNGTKFGSTTVDAFEKP